MNYEKLLWSGIALWLLETAYFGWNMTAQSGAERVLDLLSGGMMLGGVIGCIAIGAAKDYLKDKN